MFLDMTAPGTLNVPGRSHDMTLSSLLEEGPVVEMFDQDSPVARNHPVPGVILRPVVQITEQVNQPPAVCNLKVDPGQKVSTLNY